MCVGNVAPDDGSDDVQRGSRRRTTAQDDRLDDVKRAAELDDQRPRAEHHSTLQTDRLRRRPPAQIDTADCRPERGAELHGRRDASH